MAVAMTKSPDDVLLAQISPSHIISLYLHIETYINKPARTTSLLMGMYITVENGGYIDSWTDSLGSSLAGVSFNGTLPKTGVNSGETYWLVSNIARKITHSDETGKAAAFDIDWQWGVATTYSNSTQNFYKPNGTHTLNFSNLGAVTKCSIPTNLSILDNNDNTLTISCNTGIDGNGNNAYNTKFYITCDGSTPTTEELGYNYFCNAFGTSNSSVSSLLSFKNIPANTLKSFFGDDYQGIIKVRALTVGQHGASFQSNLSDVVETPFIWHSSPKTPDFITPEKVSAITGKLGSYKVSWNQGIAGINNPIKHYILKMFNAETGELVNTYTTSNLYYNIDNSAFTLGNTYYFSLTAIGEYETLSGKERCSGNLYINTISRLSAPKLSISDGLTVPKIWADTFVDIGSGDIASISWTTPTGTNNIVESYSISISYKIDGGSTMYSLLSTTNLGNVNSFSINSELLKDIVFSKSCTLTCQLRTNSLYGSSYSPRTASIDLKIIRGCGIYTKVVSGYSQPVMKRAIAFAKVAVEKAYQALVDKNGVLLLDSAGLPLYVETNTLTSTASWAPMKEFYLKNLQGQWQLSDIKYEVLTDINGEIITDVNGDPIYIL